MAMAPEQIGIGIRRYFTRAGSPPVRHGRVGAARRAHPELQGRHRRLLPARRRVPGRRGRRTPPTSSPRSTSAAPSAPTEREYVAAPGDRPRRRHDHRRGACATATSSTTHEGAAFRNELKYILVHPARRVQLAGVVQHRREGRAAAGERVLHPRRRGHDGRDPQLVPRGGHDLQGRLRLGHQPLATSARRTSTSRAAAPPAAR